MGKSGAASRVTSCPCPTTQRYLSFLLCKGPFLHRAQLKNLQPVARCYNFRRLPANGHRTAVSLGIGHHTEKIPRIGHIFACHPLSFFSLCLARQWATRHLVEQNLGKRPFLLLRYSGSLHCSHLPTRSNSSVKSLLFDFFMASAPHC